MASNKFEIALAALIYNFSCNILDSFGALKRLKDQALPAALLPLKSDLPSGPWSKWNRSRQPREERIGWGARSEAFDSQTTVESVWVDDVHPPGHDHELFVLLFRPQILYIFTAWIVWVLHRFLQGLLINSNSAFRLHFAISRQFLWFFQWFLTTLNINFSGLLGLRSRGFTCLWLILGFFIQQNREQWLDCHWLPSRCHDFRHCINILMLLFMNITE